jgi:hypothetical protein
MKHKHLTTMLFSDPLPPYLLPPNVLHPVQLQEHANVLISWATLLVLLGMDLERYCPQSLPPPTMPPALLPPPLAPAATVEVEVPVVKVAEFHTAAAAFRHLSLSPSSSSAGLRFWVAAVHLQCK